MNTLPFSLNIFKQIEIFQDIKRLDEQFDLMLADWKKGAYKKLGLSPDVNINYPTWEIEKKILLWTSRHHKHLGSPITTGHLVEVNKDFLKEIHVSQTEIAFSKNTNVLNNLVARGLATWKNGALISQQGLAYGLMIETLNKLKKDDSIRKGETKYREEKLIKRQLTFLGYELIYWSGLIVIFLSLLLLGFSVFNNLDLIIHFSSCFLFVKYLIALFSFFPFILFLVGFCLIKLKK
jgi:hypothetical protein